MTDTYMTVWTNLTEALSVAITRTDQAAKAKGYGAPRSLVTGSSQTAHAAPTPGPPQVRSGRRLGSWPC